MDRTLFHFMGNIIGIAGCKTKAIRNFAQGNIRIMQENEV